MSLQTAVNINYGFGLVGDIITDGPQRADVLNLDSNGGTIGYAFTKSSTTGVATQGGTGVFAGILANSKVYALKGTGGNPLNPTLTLPGYSQGEFLTMGTIVVTLTNTANIGDIIEFDQTTGALTSLAPGSSAGVGKTLIPNCVVWNYPNTTNPGIVAIRITD